MFGFCDIRRFTDTTEVLQEGVMEFVNTIAHLVHGAVAARGGAANKNIGDAFLLVRHDQAAAVLNMCWPLCLLPLLCCIESCRSSKNHRAPCRCSGCSPAQLLLLSCHTPLLPGCRVRCGSCPRAWMSVM